MSPPSSVGNIGYPSQFIQRIIVLLVLLRMIMGGIDGAILPIGVTSIVWELGGEFASVLFLIDGIVFASALIIAGRIGDTIGLKRVFLTGILLFTLGSAFSGLAGSMPWLICSRIVTSLGLTFSLAVSIPIVLVSIPREFHGRSIGYAAMGSGLGSALGTILCGFILQSFGWKAIPDGPCVNSETLYDIPGAVLIFLTFGIFTIGLNLGVQMGDLGVVSWALIISIFLGTVFLYWERIASFPILDFGFIACRVIAIPLVLALLIYGIYRSSLFFMPVYLSEILKVSPVNTGIILSIVAIIPAVGCPFVGYYIEKKGMPGMRRLLTIAACAGMTSSIIMLLSGVLNGVIAVIICLFLLGICITCGYTTIYAYYFQSVTPDKIGMASGVIETSSELSVSIAVILVQILFSSGIYLVSGGVISARQIIWESLPGVQAIYLFSLVVSIVILIITRYAPDPNPEACRGGKKTA
jgi:MFS family permease